MVETQVKKLTNNVIMNLRTVYEVLLFLGWFLSEDPEEEVSLLTRLEGTRNDYVTAWVQIKPIQNLTSVSEAAGGPSTEVVVHVLLVQNGVISKSLRGL